MNFISNDRAKRVDGYRAHLKSGNVVVNSNLDKLTALKTQLGKGNLKLTTQKEMQKFTEEKNRALRVQITVFAVLNVVALGVVYTAYNQMR
jgi:ribosomal protein L15E